MKTALVMMVLLGCDCDGVECQYVRTIPSGWSNIETCEAAIERQIASEQASYPLMTAHCGQQTPEPVAALPSQPDGAAAMHTATASSDDGPKATSEGWSLGRARKEAAKLVDGSVDSISGTIAWAGGGKVLDLAGRLRPWRQKP
ncbi:hypothetical protein ABFT80_23720 [Mesorhizobium sp. SB112]|uniref:hypothetical protein n=1 Tax=Mesorhizobium sp. SB112 TaxID=3151853 RepID=UPI0032644653